MKIRTTFTLSILLSALCFAGRGADGKKRGGGGDADAHRRKGIELFDAKQFAEAIQEFDKAVQAAPGDPTAYRDRGTAYRAAGRAAEAAGDGGAAGARYSSALADFSKEIELAPKEPAGYVESAQTDDV